MPPSPTHYSQGACTLYSIPLEVSNLNLSLILKWTKPISDAAHKDHICAPTTSVIIALACVARVVRNWLSDTQRTETISSLHQIRELRVTIPSAIRRTQRAFVANAISRRCDVMKNKQVWNVQSKKKTYKPTSKSIYYKRDLSAIFIYTILPYKTKDRVDSGEQPFNGVSRN